MRYNLIKIITFEIMYLERIRMLHVTDALQINYCESTLEFVNKKTININFMEIKNNM